MTKLFTALALLALATPALPCPCEGAKTTSASHATARPAVAKRTAKKVNLKEKAAVPAARPAAVAD